MPGFDKQTTIAPNIKAMMRDEMDYAPKPKNAMGKDEFLKLLLAQMQNQDPLKPMDHHEFVAQLAQFSSLEQLTNIGSGIQNLKTGMGEGAKLQALAMIGKNVQAGTQQIMLNEGQPTTIPFKPNPELKPQKAQIIDVLSGKVVRELDLSQNANASDFIWDGKNEEGKWAPGGQYAFKVMGSDAKGQFKDMTAEISGRVVGMEMNGADAILQVQTPTGVVKLELNKVRSVLEEGGTTPTPSAPIANLGAAPLKTLPKISQNVPVVNPAEDGDEPSEVAESPETEQSPNHFFENLFKSNGR